MNAHGIGPSPVLATRRLRSAPVWRSMQAVLPLGQRFNHVLSTLFYSGGYLTVPWGDHSLTIDASWLEVASTASAPIYRTPRRQNPEFFALMAPVIEAGRGGHIIDVGANIGVYTLNIRAVTPAPVISFEPDPSCFLLLAHNVAANRLQSVSVRNAACGDTAGRLPFLEGINGTVAADGDDDVATRSVPVVRLDDELRNIRTIDLIKIDCEGYEANILNGCRRIVQTQRPALFVELHPRLIRRYGHSIREICDMLRPHYRLEFYDLDPAQRSRSRAVRFLAHYRQTIVGPAGEEQALMLAASPAPPDQIFLVALPRSRDMPIIA